MPRAIGILLTGLLLVSCRHAAPPAEPGPALAAPIAIGEIQGAGLTSPLQNSAVAVQGVITAPAFGKQAFWLQSVTGDDNPQTSEAIKIQGDACAELVVGDLVHAAGTVRELIATRHPAEQPTTVLEVQQLRRLAGNQPLPATVVLHGAERGPGAWERLEGMRVEIRNAVAVSGLHYGSEIVVVADDGAAAELTARGVLPPTAKVARYVVDLPGRELPSGQLAVGTRFRDPLVGVVDYAYGYYVIAARPPIPRLYKQIRAAESTSLRGDAEHLTVASFNVENLHLGHNRRLARVGRAISENLGLPDIVALQEIQDDSGPTNDGVTSAAQTLAALVAAIPGAPYVPVDSPPLDLADGGQPGGNIRCAYLYRGDRVQLLGGPSRLVIDDPAWRDARQPVVAEFAFNGQALTLINCHLKSKGNDDPPFGRWQPPRQISAAQRLIQATQIGQHVRSLLKAQPTARIIVLGDLNDFVESSPVQQLTAAGLYNLHQQLPLSAQYTYVHKGTANALDHILVSPQLRRSRPDFDVVHCNSEFADRDRVSDHDPIVMRCRLPKTDDR